MTEAIASSSFGSIIQSWLNDLVASKPSHYYTSIYNRPWSISARPWSLDTIQYDIDKFQRCNDHKNTIAVSKKMLQNGVLGKISEILIHYFLCFCFILSRLS